jgi:hypothetical protein
MNRRSITGLRRQSTRVGDAVMRVKEAYRHYRTDCYVISYPKCGRTWLRTMLAKALAIYFNDPREIVWDPRDVVETVHKRTPFIQFTHAGVDSPPEAAGQGQRRSYYRYRNKRVIFMVRDPRDVLVSYYFQKTRRESEECTLREFVRHPWWGADRVIPYMTEWYEHRNVPVDFLLLRYEDMHYDAAGELGRALAFVGLAPVPDRLITSAVEYACFENMRQLSLSDLRDNLRLAPSDPQDPESYKIRRGEVGGYLEYLSSADIQYIEQRMRRELTCSLGYIPCRA